MFEHTEIKDHQTEMPQPKVRDLFLGGSMCQIKIDLSMCRQAI